MDLYARTDFDFEWKADQESEVARLARERAGTSLLDIGCGSCQLFHYLTRRGWSGRYVGIDSKPDVPPPGAERLTGDALTLPLPKTEICVLYNILEHVDDPRALLARALEVSGRALVAVPRRCEDLWGSGVVEHHQLDKTHRHAGYARPELERLVAAAGGRIAELRELDPIRPEALLRLVESRWARVIARLALGAARVREVPQTFWCDVVRP